MMMRRFAFALSLALSALAGGSASAATLIDFNDGSGGTDVGGFYSSLGANFSNAEWINDGGVGYTPHPDSTGLRLVADGGSLQPKSTNPIVVTFDMTISTASIIANSVNGNGARIVAYDQVSGGSQVDFAEHIGTSGNAGPSANVLLSVSGASIRRLEFFQPLSVESEGVLFDNLSFDTVPEPSSALLGALAGLAIASRRRRD